MSVCLHTFTKHTYFSLSLTDTHTHMYMQICVCMYVFTSKGRIVYEWEQSLEEVEIYINLPKNSSMLR